MANSTTGDVQEPSLGALYARCVELATNTGKCKTGFQEALDTFQKCARLIDSHHLLSSNEDADDVPTTHLRYLLVPYLFAEALSSSSSSDLEQRRRALHQAIESYSEFLRRCESYSLLGELGHATFTQQEEGGQQDPNSRRMAKIERFKREKAIDVALQRFEQARASASGPDEEGWEQGPTGGPRGLDEEDERELWFLKIELAALQALGQRESLKQETELLHHACERSSQSRGASTSGHYRPPEDPQLLEQRKAMMSKLNTIADALTASETARHRMQQNVFKPYHTLPTMTVEQAGEIEWRQAMETEERAREAEGQQQKNGKDSDEEEEVQHQRAWDDWKDDNPRGTGNSKLRPTA